MENEEPLYGTICPPEGNVRIVTQDELSTEGQEWLDTLWANLKEQGLAVLIQSSPCGAMAVVAVVPMSKDNETHLERAQKMAKALE